MPRVPPGLLRKALAIEPLLARLLPICRDIPSAHRELRWLREHAINISKDSSRCDVNSLVLRYVQRRSYGEPLQYILGTEFFGDLEIKCRPGVLIPRQETAASVTHLVRLLSSNLKTLSSHLRVLDLCTGSGCIPLLFHHEFYFKHKTLAELSDVYLDLVGIDISPIAVELAKENQALQMSRLCSKDGTRSLAHKSLKGAAFLQADILQQEAALAISNPHLSLSKSSQRHQSDTSPISVEYDIIISNPPYISRQDYWRTTTPSVRNFEPKLALVPPESLGTPSIRYDSDLFYHHILRAARQLNTRIVLVEVANLDQAKRVASLAMRQKIWKGVEIWRDDPFARAIDSTSTSSISDGIDNFDVPIVGSGEGRSVLVYRESGEQWLGKSSSGL